MQRNIQPHPKDCLHWHQRGWKTNYDICVCVRSQIALEPWKSGTTFRLDASISKSIFNFQADLIWGPWNSLLVPCCSDIRLSTYFPNEEGCWTSIDIYDVGSLEGFKRKIFLALSLMSFKKIWSLLFPYSLAAIPSPAVFQTALVSMGNSLLSSQHDQTCCSWI